MANLSELEPHLLWFHFERILKVPHPSRHEERMRLLVEDWANLRGFSSQRDHYGNLIVKIPASAGKERSPVVILQAHLDMVCERSPGSDFDFFEDEIEVQIANDWVRAVETTLGADNGIGVAAALAVADDPAAVHGPLEVLLTVEEELGLKGALQLNGTLLQGRILLNLDSEDSAFYVGCAGASETIGCFRPQFSQKVSRGRALDVEVSGLQGGHSGLSILDNPGNAIKILASILETIRRSSIDFNVTAIHGGSSRNAIPREARATLWVSEGSRISIQELVSGAAAPFFEELGGREASLCVRCVDSAAMPVQGIWQSIDADRIIDTLLACPNGVLGMSRTMPHLVETSSNLATISTSDGEVIIASLSRSSSKLELKVVSEQISALFRLAGGCVEVDSGYQGWQPNLKSSLLLKANEAYKRLFGAHADNRAIHAGLECGVIGSRIPGVDAISFGPLIEGAHAPGERVHVGSVANFYRLLTELLRELSE